MREYQVCTLDALDVVVAQNLVLTFSGGQKVYVCHFSCRSHGAARCKDSYLVESLLPVTESYIPILENSPYYMNQYCAHLLKADFLFHDQIVP